MTEYNVCNWKKRNGQDKKNVLYVFCMFIQAVYVVEPIFLFLLAPAHLHPLLENEDVATRKLCCTSDSS